MKRFLSTVFFVPLVLTLGASPLHGQDEGIPDSDREIRPLLISAEIPDVTLRDLEGQEVALRQLVSEKPTLLIFYRGGW